MHLQGFIGEKYHQRPPAGARKRDQLAFNDRFGLELFDRLVNVIFVKAGLADDVSVRRGPELYRVQDRLAFLVLRKTVPLDQPHPGRIDLFFRIIVRCLAGKQRDPLGEFQYPPPGL